MQFPMSQTTSNIGSTVTPPISEVFDSDLSKEDLLLELRAVHIVLAKTQILLDASLRRDEQFTQLTLAYRAALDACAHEERIRKELERELGAKNTQPSSGSTRHGI